MAARTGAPRAVAAAATPHKPFDIERAEWFVRERRPLPPGGFTDRPLVIPAGDASAIARDVARVIADVPDAANGTVVWRQGASELLVATESIELTTGEGVLRLLFATACDQAEPPSVITVTFAVGRDDRPAGLVMASADRPGGPAAVVDVWADALTAFAFETLVRLADTVSRLVGRDREGRPLIPGKVAAAKRNLLVHPMGRHVIPAPKR